MLPSSIVNAYDQDLVVAVSLAFLFNLRKKPHVGQLHQMQSPAGESHG